MSENNEPQLTDADAERMIQMRRAGLTFDEIARVYSVSAGTVFATLRARMPPGELGAGHDSEPDPALPPLVTEPGAATQPDPGYPPVAQHQPASPPPKRPHLRRNILIGGLSAVVVIGVAAGAAAAAAGGKAAGSAAAGCRVLEAWENSSTSLTIDQDPATQAKVEAAANGTTFATDFQNWATNPGSATVGAVIADCSAAGVPDVLNGGTSTAPAGSGSNPAPTTTATAPSPSPSPAAPPPSPSPAAPPPSPSPAGPVYTLSQQQAIDAAESYLSTEPGWSYAGLIAQLSSSYGSGFTLADATTAVNAIAPASDTSFWDAQAVDSAQSYMTTEPGWSACGLVQQLDSTYGAQFTQAQAEYAVQQVGLGTC